MHLQGLGDIAQDQRLHGNLTMLEKPLLAHDDGLGDPQQGVVPAVQALQEPARLLQLIAHKRAITRIGDLPHHARIEIVDANARRNLRVQVHAPAIAVMADIDIRHHIFRSGLADLGTGPRIQGADQVQRPRQLVRVAHAGLALQGSVVPLGQALHAVFQDGSSRVTRRGIRRQMAQLDLQALAQVPRTDAQRVALLNPVQHRLDLVDPHGLVFALADHLRQRLEFTVQIAVRADRVDQRRPDPLVSWGQVAQMQLPEQVVLQALVLAVGGILQRVAVVQAAWARGGLVDVVPATVGAQLLGDHVIASRVGLHAIPVDPFAPFLRALGRGLLALVLHLLEHGVAFQRLLDLRLQLQRGKLQQTDRLLQLRGHRQRLPQLQIKPGLQHRGLRSMVTIKIILRKH